MNILAEAADLITTIAPELGRRPFTVLDRDLGGAAYGLSGPLLAKILGLKGAAVIVDIHAIEGLPGTAGRLRSAIFEVAIHEAAHVLVSPSWPDDRAQFTLSAVAPIGSPPAGPWTGHEANWLRTCIHMDQRAARLGESIDLLGIVPGGYGLSSVVAYLLALQDEQLIRIDEPLADVLASDPPQSFTDLFAADVAAFLETDGASE